MRLHTLTVVPGARQTGKRFGRGPGSGLGKTSGRGHKGQYARSGHKYKPGFEGGQVPLIRRLPKRGFTPRGKLDFVPVNLVALNAFDDGAAVGPAELAGKGLAKGGDGIKILGTGELKRKLTVRAHAFSASAKAAIEAAGGACEVVPIRAPRA